MMSSCEGHFCGQALSRRVRSVVARCSTEDKRDSEENCDDPGRSPKRSWRPWNWIGRLASKVRLEQLVMLLFNIQLLFFLLRLWPLGGRTKMGDPQAVNVHVPFSEFVARVKANDVEAVQMDGAEMTFTLRPTSKTLREMPEGSDSVRLTYTTTRPADYPTPYDALEQHSVRFSAVEKRGNAFVTVVVCAACGRVDFEITILNRLGD